MSPATMADTCSCGCSQTPQNCPNRAKYSRVGGQK